MDKNTILKTGGVALVVAITGASGFGYSQIGSEKKVNDPLSEILQSNPASQLAGDFTTVTDPVKYQGPIPADVQECLDTPLDTKDLQDDFVYAPYNRAADINMTTEDILADIGPVLGHAVQNKEINWKWDAFSKTYKFSGNPEDSKLWYCYFKEGSPFFQEFLSTDEISVPFNDITTVSFQEKLPEVDPTGKIKHTEEEDNIFSGMDSTLLAKLDGLEEELLSKLQEKMDKHRVEFEKFESLKTINPDIISPKLSGKDFWKEIDTQKSEIQKAVKFDKATTGETTLSVTELTIDTTKEFSIQNLEQELKDKIAVTETTNPATGRTKYVLELSKSAQEGTDLAASHITSIKLKPVGDALASIIDENSDEATVDKANALYELVITLDSSVPAGTQYQAKIDGNILPDVLNENGEQLDNPLTEAIFSQINEVEGATEVTCPTTAEPVCGIESPEDAAEKNHDFLELSTYTNKCNFEKAKAKFQHEGQCTSEEITEYNAENAL